MLFRKTIFFQVAPKRCDVAFVNNFGTGNELMPIVVNSADILCQMCMVRDIGFEIEFVITANDRYT
jgi:hypothetical protein